MSVVLAAVTAVLTVQLLDWVWNTLHGEISRLQRTVGLPTTQLRALNPALREAAWRGERPLPAGYRLRLPAQTAWTATTLAAALAGEGGDAAPSGSLSGRL